MDSITHIVVGACLGELIAGKQLGKKAMLIGALANSLPDIDVVAGLWNSPSEQLLVHRGITHSIFFAIVCSPLLAYLFQKRNKTNSISFRRWLILIASGLFLHIFMDAFTAYGTGWFEPFNHARVSFNTLYILDPFFSFPLLIGAIILLILRKSALQKRKFTSLICLSLSCIYLAVSIYIKVSLNKMVETDLSDKKINYDSFMITPTPMNIILWYGIVQQRTDYYIGYYSVFDAHKSVYWELYKKHDSLLIPYKQTKEVSELIRFSQNYYSMSQQNGDLTFSDMRFGQIGGWANPQAPFVFNFNLKMQKQSKLSLQQGRFKSLNSKDLRILIDRIKGIQN